MPKPISRRDTLAALALLAARRSWAADLPLVRVSIVPIFAVAPQFAAAKFGYFTEEGIATTTQPVQGGAVGIPALVGGSFDVLYSNSISTLVAMERGIDLRIIVEATPITRTPPDPGAFLQLKGAGLKSGKDLEGKVVGVNARFDIQWMCSQGWIKKNGGDPDKVTYREVPLPSMLDAIKSGQVATALVLDPFLTAGLSSGQYEVLGWPLSTTMGGLPSSVWIVTGETAKQRGDVIHRYVKGFMKGVDWCNAHLGDEDYIELVASYTKTDINLLKKMVVQREPTSIDVSAMERLVALMREYGLLKTNVDVRSKIFT